jgi:glycosyltransferase involved in cell wall biosynthesis
LFERRNIDLVHARSRAPAWSAFLAARQLAVPFVTTYHGAYGNRGPVKALYNSVMGRGDRIIANSRYTAELIAKRHALAQGRIRLIHRGVDESTFDPFVVPPGPLSRLRERWGVGLHQQIVLHAARLTSLKGHRQVIEAASQLNREGALKKAVIIFAGDAAGKHSYRRSLLELITSRGLTDKVRLVGHCDDMPVAFLAAHVALVPSLVAETFGRTSVEAQAMGCPVIVSDLGALPETLISPEQSTTQFTGWLVPAGDVTKLTDALRVALGLSASERRQIGARAQAHAHRRFSLQQMQEKTLAVYDELLGTDLAGQFATVECR